MDISKWAFRNRNLIYFLIAVLLLGGAYSCYQMSKLEDPEIKVKLAMVVTTYPGASAHQVELEVTDVLEKNIRTMGNIDNIESYSYNDLSLIQIELLSTVPDDDVEQGDIDAFGTFAVEFHTVYPFQFVHFPFYQFGIVGQFTVGQSVTCQGIEHAIYISEVIFDYRGGGSFGQQGAGVAYFAAQHVPALFHVIVRHGAQQFYLYQGQVVV